MVCISNREMTGAGTTADLGGIFTAATHMVVSLIALPTAVCPDAD